ncbi:ClpX C4-type zinc finger protein [Usitatibacter palustris]|uniref:ATP-dependent Clp protease ATP-binding subunit ClpX zinc ribbon domain-containing protein n=1 Tax=Usitatibacter palustris TaxID=2732487 RepID=A0A6M4H398_9PROT|nr:ClpX C4-type zinc finger protein [Usitatibacter palustris]QJR13558.1 hypothetical protein DSM104440_00342 [Usitatibacter palustris]
MAKHGASAIALVAPPPALDCAHVIEYATVDDSVTFEQRHTLNVGGEWLGRVPRLAICQNLDEPTFMVFHCDDEWSVLGVAAGFGSADEAKAKVERSYHGISGRWIASAFSRDDAARLVAENLKAHSCSFCGRTPLQYQSIAGDAVRICNHCVDEFHEVMHSDAES